MRKELLQAVNRVLSHGRIILGPEVRQFEKQLMQFCQKKYAIGVNSGTDALYLALRSLNIGPGDEVITTPLSWIATVNAIAVCGATPVFVDISEDLNINVDLIEAAITPKTKVILPVHFTGKLCNILRIMEIAAKHDIFVVEDSAQSFGAHINGAMAGSFGHINCFSMNPMKVLCSYGESGAVVTDDEHLYQKIMSLRYAGTVNKENCYYPSLNDRIDTIQAAMILVNLKYLTKKIELRRKIAKFYTQALKDVVICPEEDDSSHVYYSYTIIAEKRDELKEYLCSKGIETKIQHPILMPYHTAYRHLSKFSIPVAESLVNKILCVPNEENLTFKQANYVVNCIKEFYGAC
ncbi:MAG: DegT/DnrJ/EryC1/StrS family aminotransferase [Candidatus Omnitrophota bacterium]|nr:MAG: DegT/DnrJ/EryC1/StrS family aminotransferase [Candidatus Omnitrophota bacterium]